MGDAFRQLLVGASAAQARTAPSCSPSSGGWPWLARPAGSPAGVSNRSGGPGSCTRPSVGWSTSTSRPWLSGLVPRVDLVERADPSGRDAGLVEPGEPGVRRSRSRVAPRSPRSAPARCCDPLPLGREPGVRRRPARGRRRRPATAGRCRRRPGSCRRRPGTTPYGAIAGWWLPLACGTSPATVHRVPWKAWTPTIAASSEVRTTVPRPVRSRAARAVATPKAPFIPASRSAIGYADLGGVRPGPGR